MAVAEPPTYTFIPPPPLPEFYLRETKHVEGSSSSGTSTEAGQALVHKQIQFSGDGAYDARQHTRAQHQKGPAPAVMLTPPPPGPTRAEEVPPLAIYHICRICLRPRSSRYHRSNPIPINGAPPPPGICRRCRVTSVEEIGKVADVVKVKESGEIKLGFITPFMAEEDIVTNEEMRRCEKEKLLRQVSEEHTPHRRRSDHQREIVYRHVRVAEEPKEAAPVRKAKVTLTRPNPNNIREQPEELKLTAELARPPDGSPEQVATATAKVARHGVTAASHEETTRHPADTSQFVVGATGQSITTAATVESEPANHDVRMVAREEIERYRDTMLKQERTDSDIREIARDEIDRYRHAERKLEAHPAAFAHGKLAPVERRIDTQRDRTDLAPWKNARKTTAPFNASDGSSKTGDGVAQQRKLSKSDERREVAPEGRAGSLIAQDHGRAGNRWQSRDFEPLQPAREQQTRQVNAGKATEEVTILRKPRPQADEGYERRGGPNRPSVPDTPDPVEGWQVDISHQRVRPARQPKLEDRPLQRAAESIHSRFSNPSDREYSFQGGFAQTVNSGSSRQQTEPGNREQREEISCQSKHAVNYSIQRQKGSTQSTELSDKTRWPQQEESREQQAQQDRAREAPPSEAMGTRQDNIVRYSNILDSYDTPPPPGEMSERRSRNDDVEYGYTERIVQPADRPLGSRPFDERPPEHRMEEETLIHTRRRPTAPEQYHRQPDQAPRPLRRVEVTEEEYIARISPQEGKLPRKRRENRNRQTEARDNGRPNHVHFSSKVEISPTPPNSDASSSAFRSFHSFGRGHGREVDGNAETGEDLIAEYERRGRTRSREARAGRRYYYVERQVHRDQTVRPDPRTDARKYDGVPRPRPGGRPLVRALSESPAREESLSDNTRSREGTRPDPEIDDLESMKTHDGDAAARARTDDEIFLPRRQHREADPR